MIKRIRVFAGLYSANEFFAFNRTKVELKYQCRFHIIFDAIIVDKSAPRLIRAGVN